MHARLALALTTASVLALGAGCPKSATVAPPGPPAVAADTAALCADLAALVAAAPGNFADDRTETAVRRDNQDGVAAQRAVSGTLGCLILRPDPGYPDDMVECDLAEPGAKAAADAVLVAWAPKVAGCPVVQNWQLVPGLDAARSWQEETPDNHLIEIQLDLSGDPPSLRPVLRVRRPEI